ncbi:MAG: YitT family protein [Saprospiraceae bacterium]|nr:YitT family protein [Saprospiraceae bacterium]
MNYTAVHDKVIALLRNQLSSHLSYHNVQHTLDVIDQSERIARNLNVAEEEIVILKTAALFHDTGFLVNHLNHEEISCRLAKEELSKYDYSDNCIDRICKIIMATKIPQSPTEMLAEILCDADLYYLGTNQYVSISNNLLKEYQANGIVKSVREWPDIQIGFLSSHHYFTPLVQEECNSLKNENLQNVLHQKHNATEDPYRRFKDYFQIALGVILVGIGLKGFLVPNHFFDGGNTGIALLIRQRFGIDLSLILLFLNLPYVIAGYYSIGRKFAIRTLISLILLGLFILYIPIHGMTHDKLLIALFGGAFLGIGTGMVMRAGAAIDGIEVLALYTLKKTSFTMTEIIMGINIIIFAIAGLVYGIEISLYSVLTYVAATRCIDYIVEGLHAYTGVTIISAKSQEIKYEIVNSMGRAITVYKGERGYLPGQYQLSNEVDIIFTVINRLELRKLKNLVYSIDSRAFVYSNTIKEASGGIIKRRIGH